MIEECSTTRGRESSPRMARVARLVATALLLASGCGEDDGIAQRYPVSGTVTYNDKPLERGSISFQAVSPGGRSAGGEIQNGAYSLTTQTANDGALPGKYRVSITAKDVDMSAVEATSRKQGGTMPSKKDIGKAFQKAKRLIPAKYESPATSGFEVEIKEQSSTHDFALKD